MVPDDLADALNQPPQAAQCFEVFSPSEKKGILQWIKSAKRSPTRQQRIAKTVECAVQNIQTPSLHN
ncbi:MAG: YdeI/OmpD-associated family protein [Cyanobacteria bacterium P01_A01_bin.37]